MRLVFDEYRAICSNFIIILTGGDTEFLAKRLKNTIFAKFPLESLNQNNIKSKMIKKIIVSACLLLSLVSFAQEGTASPYSYGIGDVRFKGTVENRSMAG
jgi:hypothetical protein